MRCHKNVISIFILLFCFIYISGQEVQAASSDKTPLPLGPRVDRTDFPTLWLNKPELQGEAVWMVQARLKELGYDLTPNGVYDAATNESIWLFQVANGMKADGVVSRSVWEALMYNNDSRTCLAESNESKKMLIEIDVGTHLLTLYENGNKIRQYPVGVGKSKTPSPLGEWKVVNKCLNWGNGFGTRWLGLNVPWGIYGIHGTNKPYSIGASMSHGCIRMRNRDVEELYPLVPAGIRVRIVENGKIFPEDFRPRKLNRKCSGQDVVYVQSRLKELGVVFDNADGRFGAMTELAVKYFQVWHNLEPTGVMDENTYRTMGMIK